MDEADKTYTVLIVDDNVELLDLLVNSLQRIGHFNVIGAPDGIAGLQRYYELRPDCMVIDIKMPGLDGYQLVQALRGDADSMATPLIMLTALAQDKDRYAGLAFGADQFLVKPVKPQDLAQAIHQAIAVSQEERLQRLQEIAEEPPPNV